MIVEYGSSDCVAPGETHGGTRNLLVEGGEVVVWMSGGLRGSGTRRSSGAWYPTGGSGSARRGIAPRGDGGGQGSGGVGGSRGSGGHVDRCEGGVSGDGEGS